MTNILEQIYEGTFQPSNQEFGTKEDRKERKELEEITTAAQLELYKRLACDPWGCQVLTRLGEAYEERLRLERRCSYLGGFRTAMTLRMDD